MSKRQITLQFEIEDMPTEEIERLTQNFTAGTLALQAVYQQKQAEAMQALELAFQPAEAAATAGNGPALYPAKRRVVMWRPDPVTIPAPETPEQARVRRAGLRKPSTWKRFSNWLSLEMAALRLSAYESRHEIAAVCVTGWLFCLGVAVGLGVR